MTADIVSVLISYLSRMVVYQYVMLAGAVVGIKAFEQTGSLSTSTGFALLTMGIILLLVILPLKQHGISKIFGNGLFLVFLGLALFTKSAEWSMLVVIGATFLRLMIDYLSRFF